MSSRSVSTVRVLARKDSKGNVKHTLSSSASSLATKLRSAPARDVSIPSAKSEGPIVTEFALLCALFDDSPVRIEPHSLADIELQLPCTRLQDAITPPAAVRANPEQFIPDVLCGRLAEALSSSLPGPGMLRAALRIQTFLRPRLPRSKRAVPSRLSRLFARHLKACLMHSQTLKLSRYESRLLLWSLPHALACLEVLRTQFELEKDVLSRKLQKVPHEQLEDAGAKVVGTQ